MTVSSEISRNDRVGDGVLDTFIFEFEIYAKTDILVYVGGVLKTVDTHYTVPVAGINNAAGGTIVFTAGNIPINLAKIAIILDLPLTQLTDYVEGDKFPAETHEAALDRLVKLAQALSNRLDSVLKIPVYNTLGNIVVPIAAGEFLAWNEDGDAIVTVPTWEAGDPLPAHGDDHENGGIDEINLEDLSGMPADVKTLKLDDLATPDNNTDLDVSIAKHGLTPKLPNDATKYLNGTGGYTVPPKGFSTFKWLATASQKINAAALADWADVNISADTGSDIATAAILGVEVSGIVAPYASTFYMAIQAQFRKNGSSETDKLPKITAVEDADGSYNHTSIATGMIIVELDASEIFEAKFADIGTRAPASVWWKVNLIGYIV